MKKIKELYPTGTKIRLIRMDNPQAPPTGTVGVVTFVNDIGQIHVSWENRSSIALSAILDKFKVIDIIHYLIIKKNNETIFEKQIFNNDKSFDEEFYKNLNIKFNAKLNHIELQKINIEKFFLEWINYLERNPSKDTFLIYKILKTKSYIFHFGENLFDEYYKLKEGYEAYIEAN